MLFVESINQFNLLWFLILSHYITTPMVMVFQKNCLNFIILCIKIIAVGTQHSLKIDGSYFGLIFW